MSKSALYAVNTAAQAVLADGIINFGMPVRRFGCNCNINNGNVVLKNSGYYDIDVSLTFEGTAALTPVITVYKDGVAVPGATASVTTAADTTYTVNIPLIARNTDCNESIITVVSDAAIDVTNAAIVVERI